MASLNDIIVRLRVDDKDVDVTLDDFAKQLKGVEKTGKQSGKSLGEMFSSMKAGYLAAAAALSGVVMGINSTIKAASNLEEVNNKFGVVFSGLEEQAESMANNLVENYMMSERAAKQYLSSVQDLLVPMGMAKDAAASMSGEVVKLAADLGSFNNMPTEQVMMDIQSALVGNFETMKKYGVILNETTIKQAALNSGVWDGKGMIDANTKAQLAFQIMTKNSSAAIGDVARSSDSYANTQKLVAARFEDLQASIGQLFMPVAKSLLDITIGLIGQFQKFVDWVDALSQKFLGSARALNEFRQQIQGLTKDELGMKLKEVNSQMEKLEQQMIDTNITDWKNQVVMAFGAATGNAEMAAGKFGALQGQYDRLKEQQQLLTAEMKKYGGAIDGVNTNLDTNTSKSKEAFTTTLEWAMKSSEAFDEYKRNMESFYGEDMFAMWEVMAEKEQEMAEESLEMKYEMGLLDYEQYAQFLNDKMAVAAMVYGSDHTEYLKWLKKRQQADKSYYEQKRILTTKDKLDTISNLASIVANTSAQNKKNFAIQKRASQVIAVMDTIEGAQKAFNAMADIPVVGPILGAIAAAAALAAGYARVREIESQQFFKGGYTGSGGKYEPAGTVHKGEVVFSQSDVAAWGGPGNVEKLRTRSFASGGVVDGIVQDTMSANLLIAEFQGLREDFKNLKWQMDFDQEQIATYNEKGAKQLARRTV